MSLKEFNKEEIEEYIDIVYNSANNTLYFSTIFSYGLFLKIKRKF